MERPTFRESPVDPADYSSSFRLVWVAWLVPIVFFLLDLWRGSPDWFPPSGAFSLFLIAFVQFRQLSRIQWKHFKNAERAAKGETIQTPSRSYQKLDKRVFWAAAYGTLVWAYGDKLVESVLRLTNN